MAVKKYIHKDAKGNQSTHDLGADAVNVDVSAETVAALGAGEEQADLETVLKTALGNKGDAAMLVSFSEGFNGAIVADHTLAEIVAAMQKNRVVFGKTLDGDALLPLVYASNSEAIFCGVKASELNDSLAPTLDAYSYYIHSDGSTKIGKFAVPSEDGLPDALPTSGGTMQGTIKFDVNAAETVLQGFDPTDKYSTAGAYELVWKKDGVHLINGDYDENNGYSDDPLAYTNGAIGLNEYGYAYMCAHDGGHDECCRIECGYDGAIIRGLQDPTDSGDGTNKSYVDRQVATRAGKTTLVDTTITTTWGGSEGAWTQTLTVNGVTAANTNYVKPADSATDAQREAFFALKLRDRNRDGQAAGKIYLLAEGEKNTIAIPVTVTVMGDG